MVGAQMLPQTKVIPQVDLVISHGGNNTVTETLHFGKPLIVLPLFWDQYENAQRIDELGFGVRLDTYGFADDELTGAVDRLLADTELRARLAEIGAAIRGRDGLAGGCRRHRAGGRAASSFGCLSCSTRSISPTASAWPLSPTTPGCRPLPMVCDADGRWRRAAAGDGVAEALLDVLARGSGLATRGRFTVQSWTGRAAWARGRSASTRPTSR